MTEMFDLAGKVCLVTGAAQGIGREVARLIVRLGGKVGAIDLNGEALKSLGFLPKEDLGDLAAEHGAQRTKPGGSRPCANRGRVRGQQHHVEASH